MPAVGGTVQGGYIVLNVQRMLLMVMVIAAVSLH
eukprot:CAMPEP_0119484050 /NCGR_PEP_ID=MMETSP1344-20130328/11179_1 /TAXON_ID=236787 /ORGANISM="Florenciella parvula, Strain CCMP2471" /LENGTH=33 /DNA_ID= /DNA_START= /DNA_END= /DNA_ORIENTATION=